MKVLLVILSTLLVANITNAQASTNDRFDLKAFVGKEGLDTMTKEEFLKCGKVELNYSKLKVNSFLLIFEGELSYRKIDGNSFNYDWVKELLNKIKKETYTLIISDITFFRVDGVLVNMNKDLRIVLKK